MMENKSNLGTIAMGVRLPVIREGDNISEMVVKSVIAASNEMGLKVEDGDVFAITESIVARAEGNYITVDDIAKDIIGKFGENADIAVIHPIYSRNRFSLILKGIARAARKVKVIYAGNCDEVGNETENPYTGVDILEFYHKIVAEEGAIYEEEFSDEGSVSSALDGYDNVIVATIHSRYNVQFTLEHKFSKLVPNQMPDMPFEYMSVPAKKIYRLDEICNKKTDGKTGYNDIYGILGSNKSGDEVLKLFPRPSTCQTLVNQIRDELWEIYDAKVEVMVYGDGAYKDPVSGIWELADPVVSPGYTEGLEGKPNEVKLKYIVDSENLSDDELLKRIMDNKDSDSVDSMSKQGTTPRHYTDLLGSLSDLVTGSGDKGTPIVWVKNYFKKYCD